ncbi:MAG: hypothetical protein ABI759_01845 [Candidatus Solibacter sp.]
MRPIVPPQPVGNVEQIALVGIATPHGAPGIAAVISAIIDGAALPQLSLADMGKLIRILDPPALTKHPSQSQDLLSGAISAVQSGEVNHALEQLADLVKLDPSGAQTLRTEPGLEQIRTQVNHLLIRLETVAGLDAQGRLAEAAEVLLSLAPHPLAGWDTPPQVLLTMANRLYDAGGYVNYVHAASLAQLVFEGASRVPLGIARSRQANPQRESVRRPKSAVGPKTLWMRAPLLILLVSWFLLGLAAAGVGSILHYFWPGQFPASIIDTGFALWGVGFLALVVIGFYVRIRHVRFR